MVSSFRKYARYANLRVDSSYAKCDGSRHLCTLSYVDHWVQIYFLLVMLLRQITIIIIVTRNSVDLQQSIVIFISVDENLSKMDHNITLKSSESLV